MRAAERHDKQCPSGLRQRKDSGKYSYHLHAYSLPYTKGRVWHKACLLQIICMVNFIGQLAACSHMIYIIVS